jgi:hypothetical protein
VILIVRNDDVGGRLERIGRRRVSFEYGIRCLGSDEMGEMAVPTKSSKTFPWLRFSTGCKR